MAHEMVDHANELLLEEAVHHENRPVTDIVFPHAALLERIHQNSRVCWHRVNSDARDLEDNGAAQDCFRRRVNLNQARRDFALCEPKSLP